MRDHGLQSYAEIVTHYKAEKKPKAKNERRWFRIQRKVYEAVRLAGLAQAPGGKRFRHQHRLSPSILQRASRSLLRRLRVLGKSRSFHELFQRVEATIGPIKGVGPLMVYDTALRIGARLGLEPEMVYVHAGTGHGAVALGFGRARTTIALSELPKPMNELSPE